MTRDPDSPDLTAKDFAEMRPASEALPADVLNAFKRTKLDALRAAVEVGLEDVRQGRVVRLAPGEVEPYVAGLGRTGEPEA